MLCEYLSVRGRCARFEGHLMCCRVLIKKLVKVKLKSKKTLQKRSVTISPVFTVFIYRISPHKGGVRGFNGCIYLSVGVYFVRWGALLELFFPSRSQKKAQL